MELNGVLEKNKKDNYSESIDGEQKIFENESDSYNRDKSIYSIIDEIISLAYSYEELKLFNNGLDRLISSVSAYYWFFKETCNISRNPRNKILLAGKSKHEYLKAKRIKLSYSFSPESFKELQQVDFDQCISVNEYNNQYKVDYFKCLNNIKRDNLEGFMSESDSILNYHFIEAGETMEKLQENYNSELDRSRQLLTQFFSNTEDGLITELIRAYIETRQNNIDTISILELIDHISDKFKKSVSYFEEKYNESLNIDILKLSTLLGSIKPGNSSSGYTEQESYEFIPAELEGSLDRILEFSLLPNDKVEFFKDQLRIFREMENKDKIELMQPEAKSRFISTYFELYEAVFKRCLKENINDKAFDMFLVFGCLDNSLLTNQQTIALSKLLDLYESEGNVYTMKRWLTKVYNSEKAPSINDLGEEYEQVIGEKRQRGQLPSNGKGTDKNCEDRLNYEIMNMFKTNHRLCYGHISTYFPIMHSEMLPKDISRAAVTIGKLNDCLLNIMNVDFSAFHREVFYTGDNPNFKKEFIMKQVIPDIILLPIMGSKAIMWQELSGHSKLTPGRFMMPIFTLEDLNSMVTKLVGNFRWELCRTVMGFRWNDISNKSLTSEYSDYIQFYKKNNNLTEEYKENIRLQIQRYRNNLRDIFTSDYEAWIKYEAEGIRKVNKEARTILYNYCPFRRQVREELIKQPAFASIAAPFEFKRKKFAKELENKYVHFTKKGQVLESEFEENLRFFKEM